MKKLMFRKHIYILSVLMFIGCHSATDYLNEGHNLVVKGDYASALILFGKAIDKDPKLREGYIQKGVCFENLHQEDAAITEYQKLLSFDSKNTTALYYIGLCKYEQKKYGEAIDYFTKAFISKGALFTSDSSETGFTVDINKDGLLGDISNYDVPSHDLYYQRGLAYYSCGEIKKAYKDFLHCVSQGYYVGQSYYMIGLCWLAANNKDKACDAFKEGSFNGDSLATELYKSCK